MSLNDDKLYEYLQLKKELLQLPIVVEDGCDVYPRIFSEMEQYLSIINENTHLRQYLSRASITVQRLKDTIKAYLKGNIDMANSQMNLILDDLKSSTKYIISTIDECLYEDEVKQLYKARRGDFYSFTEEDMFHIPFNKRGLIQNQRYSINGMPCLYLGTSTYVCWEELGRPDFDSFWVSRFEVENKLMKILNLSYTLQDIIDSKKYMNDSELEKLLIEYFLTWILQCVSSITVKNKNRIFREEYVIPQLIMQNIRKADIDGIMYFSTRGTYKEGYCSWIMKNFAFPADDYELFLNNVFNINEYKNNKLSMKLKEAFSLTPPINMGLIKAVDSDDALSKSSKVTRYMNEALSKGKSINNESINLYRTRSTITLSEKNHLKYEYTNFYKLEEELKHMFANQIN